MAPIVNQLVETPLLREHGVEGVQFLATRAKNDMSQLPPVPAQCGHVVFLMRPDVEYVDTLQAWVKSVRETRDDVDLSALFVPRRTVACDQALDTAGIAGDIACFEVDILMLPVERDVVSLEIERAFAEVVLEGDTSSLFYAATALLRFQQRFGGVESVLAVGRAAAATCGILAKLRHGLQASELPRPGGKIESIVIIDRAADLVSTLLTQMTYEGLIDEVVVSSDVAARTRPGEQH